MPTKIASPADASKTEPRYISSMTTIAHPPETLEGWYLSHHVYSADRAALRALGADRRARVLADADETLGALAPASADGG